MRKSVLFITAVAAFSIMTLSAISLALSYSGEAEALAQLSAQENHARAAEPPRASTPTPRPEPADPAPEPLVPAETAYIVRAQDGQVAVYLADAPDAPVEVTDIRVASLREFDQRQLKQGIPVQGEEALARLLEDFAP